MRATATVMVLIGLLLLAGSALTLTYGIVGLVTHTSNWRITMFGVPGGILAAIFIDAGRHFLRTRP